MSSKVIDSISKEKCNFTVSTLAFSSFVPFVCLFFKGMRKNKVGRNLLRSAKELMVQPTK